jgi:hypothetical protein
MNYSNSSNMVRVDFFKESGKWYTTEAMEWLSYEKEIHQAFIDSLRAAFIKGDGHARYSGMTAVCLQPYSKNEHPLMLHNWDAHE